MGRVIIQLVPAIIGAAAVPICIILVLLLLRGQDALFKASAFAAGQILIRLAQGIGFGLELGFSKLAQTTQGASGIIHTLILVAGILMWMTALVTWVKEEDPEAPPPRWMSRVGSFSRLKAFGLGMMATAGSGKQWIFTFYAVGVVREAGLPLPHKAVALMIFILGAQSTVLLPIGLYAIARRHSSHLLETATLWLERNNQTIVMVVSIAFGTFFVVKGIRGLLG